MPWFGITPTKTLWVRLHRLTRYSKFRVKEVGRKHRLQLLMGKIKNKPKWGTVSYHFFLPTYKNWWDLYRDLCYLKDEVDNTTFKKIVNLARRNWRR